MKWMVQDSYIHYTIHFLMICHIQWTFLTITVLNKISLKVVADVLRVLLNLPGKTYKYMQWYLMDIDVIESKLYREPPVRQKRRSPENICEVLISNKAVELINPPSKLNNTQ